MQRPVTATYRLQFSVDSGFRAAKDLVPYLDELGISHIYASPLLTPRSGSAHGYDVIDPTSLNAELGEEDEFHNLLAELASRNMGLILDIVPNHMAADTRNPWWSDVLEYGRHSRYRDFFDIDWNAGMQDGRPQLVLPVLGDHFSVTLENGELQLSFDESGFALLYFEHRFPIDPASYNQVLDPIRELMATRVDERFRGQEALDTLRQAVQTLHELDADHGDDRERRLSGSATIKRQLWRLYAELPDFRQALDETLNQMNGDTRLGESRDQLQSLIDEQNFRLTFWRRASESINYRRFFDIADLVSLRVEDPYVFDAVHTLILEMASTDGVDGFRIDHIDGLNDPTGYLHRLRERLRAVEPDRGYYLLAEKILTGDEHLPEEWDAEGTTGYEFAHRVNALLVDPEGLRLIERNYRELINSDEEFEEVVHRSKARILDQLFAGEFRRLADELFRLATRTRHGRDLSKIELSRALRAFMIHLPVYRTYIRGIEVPHRDRSVIESTLEATRNTVRDVERRVWAFLGEVLLAGDEDETRMRWVSRWQQMTGPLMAKGLEDTALYAYTPLLSLNEVGGEPIALDLDAFHRHNTHVSENWPGTMLSSSTHDTKRSEDVRARIAVLSEMAGEWIETLDRWRSLNEPLRTALNGKIVPDPNEEQFIYQTLLGAWPLEGSGFSGFRDRVTQYLTKAMREAKIHTSWIDVDEQHEAAVLAFVDRLFEQEPSSQYVREFLALQTRISSYGAWNSLSALVLKLTAPGFPDIYQGNELWDFSLADPDNRRPVDFERRQALLTGLDDVSNADITGMLERWRDGRLKLLITARLLRARRSLPELFIRGGYEPLEATGSRWRNVVAFCRQWQDRSLITIVPRLTVGLTEPDAATIGPAVWGDTAIHASGNSSRNWLNLVTGEHIEVTNHQSLDLATALATTPVAVLINS